MNSAKSFLLIVLMTGILCIGGQALYGKTGLVMALGIGLVMNAVSYFFSDSIVLASYRAQVLQPGEAPELQAIVANLAERAGLPNPRVAIIPDETPNAFATGRNPEHAVVAVTEGLVRMMDR